MSRVHALKTWPAPFEAMRAGRKTFEYRLNDRDFQIGDCLVLQEYNPETDSLTRECLSMRVVYVLAGGQFGIPPKYCAMSVEPWEKATQMPGVPMGFVGERGPRQAMPAPCVMDAPGHPRCGCGMLSQTEVGLCLSCAVKAASAMPESALSSGVTDATTIGEYIEEKLQWWKKENSRLSEEARQAFPQGVAHERRRIVAWLREYAEEAAQVPGPKQYEDALNNAAEAIEDGDHYDATLKGSAAK